MSLYIQQTKFGLSIVKPQFIVKYYNNDTGNGHQDKNKKKKKKKGVKQAQVLCF